MLASTRWSTLVNARLAEMERLDPERAAVGPAFWDARAKRFAAAMAGTAERDPLFARLRRATGPDSTVLDVGAGPGRFALALAPRVRHVVAVDASAAMVAIVDKQARRMRLANVDALVGRWPDVDVAPASVSVCSYVLPLVADAKRFLAKLDDCTTERAFLYLGAASLDFLTDPLWRHFHGKPRRPGPTYLDAVAVLAELGIRADVEVVELRTRARHKDLGAAVKAYRDQLVLPDDASVRRELRALLSAWLVKDRGQLRPPVRTTPAAIVSWSPRRN
ncbi:MAG TPA: methyltransferase domain-containing protein [Acidimicrobiales bacterium]|nr:methyltransferase domain-containing protein [Acidimicrobiales bacterium]